MAKLALFLLLEIVILIFVHCRPEEYAADINDDVWQKAFPSVEIPAALKKAYPSVEANAVSGFISQLNNGHLASPALFCNAAHFACKTVGTKSVHVGQSSYNFGNYGPGGGTSVDRMFFHENTLTEGGNIHVPELSDKNPSRALLSKALAKALPPLSEKQLPHLLQLLSIPSDSPLASSMQETAGTCDSESGSCASSVEDLALSTAGYHKVIYQADKAGPFEKTKVVKHEAVPVERNEIMACHPLMYPHQVIFCHTFKTQDTKVYKIEVEGSGEGSQLFAVCHRDTSSWNPAHSAFKDLNSSPGKTDACHLLPQNHMVWY